MRTAVHVVAELVSPMVIVRERQERVYSCLDHIPGTTLRGALLSALWRQGGRDTTLKTLLTPGRNRFPYLWPGPLGTTPTLATTMSCKRARADHGLRDTLLARYQQNAQAAAWKCESCGQDLKRQEGYVHHGALVPPVRRSQRMHVGIDRQRGTAAQHILFGATAVEPFRHTDDGHTEPLRLSGTAWLREEDIETLQALTQEPIYIGKQRSRGFGEVRLLLERARADERAAEIANGSATLAQRLGACEGTYFTLGVVSPLIAYDPWLRASARWEHWGLDTLEIETVDEFIVETAAVDGWDFAAGIARDAEAAVAPGSVMLARSRLSATVLAERLAVLERRGVGERLGEGFGEVRANDKIHWELG